MFPLAASGVDVTKVQTPDFSHGWKTRLSQMNPPPRRKEVTDRLLFSCPDVWLAEQQQPGGLSWDCAYHLRCAPHRLLSLSPRVIVTLESEGSRMFYCLWDTSLCTIVLNRWTKPESVRDDWQKRFHHTRTAVFTSVSVQQRKNTFTIRYHTHKLHLQRKTTGIISSQYSQYTLSLCKTHTHSFQWCRAVNAAETSTTTAFLTVLCVLCFCVTRWTSSQTTHRHQPLPQSDCVMSHYELNFVDFYSFYVKFYL